MMKLELDADLCILQAVGHDEPEREDCTYEFFDGAINWSEPTPTSRLRFIDGLPVWEDVATLDELKARAIAKTYADVDSIHFAAVGNRLAEYQDAERAAREFAEGGYVGEADDDVHSFALDNPTGQVQTDQWAADNIIARADAFRSAQKAMRNQRFKSQGELRAATTNDELRAAEAVWRDFIAALRGQLGI